MDLVARYQAVFKKHGVKRRQRISLLNANRAEAYLAGIAAQALGLEGSLQPHIYSTLFGLMASTGLRISEALNLRIEDVTSDGLIVRNTKFAKSRLLPLHPSTRTRLEDYLERRLQEASTCAFVFISIKGVQLHANRPH